MLEGDKVIIDDKPLKFYNSSQYLAWKERREEKIRQREYEDEDEGVYNIYKIYFTHVVNGERLKKKFYCLIAAQTIYRAEKIFYEWAKHYKIIEPRIRDRVEIFWVKKDKDILVNFTFDYENKKIIGVLTGYYLKNYWVHLLKIDKEVMTIYDKEEIKKREEREFLRAHGRYKY